MIIRTEVMHVICVARKIQILCDFFSCFLKQQRHAVAVQDSAESVKWVSSNRFDSSEDTHIWILEPTCIKIGASHADDFHLMTHQHTHPGERLILMFLAESTMDASNISGISWWYVALKNSESFIGLQN